MSYVTITLLYLTVFWAITFVMEVIVESNKDGDIKKVLFQPKPPKSDGQVLKIDEKKDKKTHAHCRQNKNRFVQCCFNILGNIVACMSITGEIFIVDILLNCYWSLPTTEKSNIIKFSNVNDKELLIGTECGDIILIETTGGCETGRLIGHTNPVKFISFSNNQLCVTTSKSEGILWNLQSNTKIQILNLDEGFNLKFLTFIPVTNNILSCLDNDCMQLWKYGSWKYIKYLYPDNWNNHSIRNVTFTNNGLIMIIVGYLPNFAIVSMNSCKICKILQLPEYILSVRHMEIIPLLYEWKCSKTLVILSGHGIIYFYDLELEKITSKLSMECEIIKFTLSPQNYYMSILLCTGAIYIYNISQYIETPYETPCEEQKIKRKKIKLRPCRSPNVKKKINELLTIDKLKAILIEYVEYPKLHRLTIWENLLQLPNNVRQYNNIINHVTIVSFSDLNTKYPLESENCLRSLRILLNNLVTWCPFFANVTFLPVFVFPFIKVFHNKPIECFEAVSTILLNWCQHWFEYYPLPPVNILAIIENILYEQDPDLLSHMTVNKITPNLYIWPLLETAFTEVLTTKEWLLFWDHVLTNEIAFFLCAAASYNIIHRTTLLTLATEEGINYFYHNQNPNDTRKFISKTYFILKHTSEKLHPRQYLNNFKKLEPDGYPVFMGYPKTIVEFESNHMSLINKEIEEAKYSETMVLKEKMKEWKNLLEIEKKEIENERRMAMEKACMEKIHKEQEKINEQHKKLEKLRQSLLVEEKDIMDYSLKKLQMLNDKEQAHKTEFLLGNVELGKIAEDHKFNKAEEELLCRYSDLLKHKYMIAELFMNDPLPGSHIEGIVLQNQQNKLGQEIDKFRRSLHTKEDLKTLNISTGLLTTEQLIRKVEEELVHELTQKYKNCDKEADKRFLQLESEAKGLEKDVARLIKTLRDNKSDSDNVEQDSRKISIEDIIYSRGGNQKSKPRKM